MKISDILKNHENDLKNGIVTESLKKDIKQYEYEYKRSQIIEYSYMYRCMWLSLMLYITNKDIRSDLFRSSVLYYVPDIDSDVISIDRKTMDNIKEEQFNNAKNELGLDLNFNDYKDLNTMYDVKELIDGLDGEK